MKRYIRSIILAATFIVATGHMIAQTTNAPTFIRGTMDIQFKTRTDRDDTGKNPQQGVLDTYKLVLNVSDSAIFEGEITHMPTIFSSLIGREEQSAKLIFNVNASVVNPKNIKQTRPVGRLTGTVPIDGKGVYRYNEGTLRIGIDSAGTAQGFESKFTGNVAGKPPISDSLAARAKKQAMSITREVKGKTVTVVVKDYDKMVFNGHILAAGPVKTYPESQINGEMVYDYERVAWYFNNVSVSYMVDGKAVTDKLTGNIRWVKSPQYNTTGEGEYQFDVRVNEPEVKSTEASVFAAPADENAFFEANTSVNALIGTMKYKDSLSGETVTQSKVTIDLVGQGLNRQQTMYLCKLIGFTGVIPINAE